MNKSKEQHKALIVVDYQNDFCDPKGTLYVPQGEKIKNYLIQKILVAKQKKHFVVASLD